MGEATCFLAIKIMDEIFNKIDFDSWELKLIVLLGLWISSKMEEQDAKVLPMQFIFL